MSTYSFASKLRKGKRLYAALLSGILVTLQLVLPAIIFASSSASGFTFGQSQALDRASVSVVRLVVSYGTNSPTPPGCTSSSDTGLGVLVGSWALAGSPGIANWVLTDGSLVNPDGRACGTGRSSEQLSSIQLYASTAYASDASALLGSSLACSSKTCNGQSLICQLSSPGCAHGAVLVPFTTTVPQPFIDMAPAQTGPKVGIGLTNPSQAPPTVAQAAQSVIPASVTSLTGTSLESGMPIVNSDGQLEDMQTLAIDTSIPDFVTTQLKLATHPKNALHDAWNAGITAYYAPNLADAKTNLQRAGTLNSAFQAPGAFLNLPAFKNSANIGNGTSTAGASTPASASGEQGINLFGYSIPNSQLIWLVLLGVIILIALLALLSLALVRRQAQSRREAEILRRAERKAEIDAARIAEQEKAERQQPQAQPVVAGPLMNNAATPGVLPVADLRCPNCGHPVKSDDNFCANCRAVLSPTDSGLHRRATPPPVSPPAPAPVALPPAGVVPAAEVYDQPTREMSPSQYRNGQEEEAKTLPFATEELKTLVPAPAVPVEQFIGRNMSLAVGTRSNPGIKRQHKPNEDSLFAAQGERTYNSHPQQFGLFVVADGMGGHANGQDASRLAIQTIVDRILPRLSGSEQFTDDALVQLLVDGVKEANLAVHQRNMEHRADMGTTMTAALVVGAMAFVANVGDSRTYLYRQPGGLRKVTNDHSVVASLVEAGIIKPDDIYTHPKRNQIYRSLGEKPVIDVDSFKVPLQPGDKLLLCSDGLWDMVRDPTIEQILNAVPDPSQTGNALIQAALDGGGEDNVSVIVVYISEATQRTGMTGVQLLARPEAPQYPPM